MQIDEIILLSTFKAAMLCLGIFWVLLSAAVVKLTFFPTAGKETTSDPVESETSETKKLTSVDKQKAKPTTSETAKTFKNDQSVILVNEDNKKPGKNGSKRDKRFMVTSEAEKTKSAKLNSKNSKTGAAKGTTQKPLRLNDIGKKSTSAKEQTTNATKASDKPSKTQISNLTSLTKGLKVPADLKISDKYTSDASKHRIYMTTGSADALEIGTAFADELTRLGYEIEPVNHQEAKATKDGKSIFMKIEPKAADAKLNGLPRFPSANSEAVVIELWLDGNKSVGVQ